MLPKEAIEEFQQIYLKDTGVLISSEEATKIAILFFNALESIVCEKSDA